MGTLREFEVDATNPFQPRVVVDGVEQTRVRRVSVDIHHRTVPAVYLEFFAGGRFAGSGDVTVQTDGPEPIRAWLAAVNPDALEQAALAAEQASGGPMGPGQMFKAGLIALLDGQHG